MTDTFCRTSISLRPALLRRLDDIVEQRSTTRSAVVRDALDHYFEIVKTGGNLRRIAMVAEYSQAALDLLMREQHPSRVEDLVQVVAARMEKFHGGR